MQRSTTPRYILLPQPRPSERESRYLLPRDRAFQREKRRDASHV